MEPVGYFQRHNGEYVIVHACFGCGLERFNRIAADDDFDLVVSLPAQKPSTSREAKAERLEAWLAEQEQQWEWDAEEAG
jgi:predicted  nucleic acid-binding Zn-ribbon protein